MQSRTGLHRGVAGVQMPRPDFYPIPNHQISKRQQKMPRVEISEDVLDFISRRIDSVPHLEVLLLMWEKPLQAWTEDEIARRVYVSRDQARMILQDIARHGFIVAAVAHAYRYEPGWDQADIMSRLAASYRQHLVHVAGLIHSKTASGAVAEFARAFEFKQKE